MVLKSWLHLAETVVTEAAPALSQIDNGLLRLPPLPSPRELLKLYKIQARRSLSQNFLLDSRINNKIVTRTGDIEDCYVFEVGPGPGNITRAILQNGARRVYAIEKDRRFLPSLQLLAEASNDRLRIVLADIMDLNLENILDRNIRHEWNIHPPPLYIIGNLPFNISTPLIIKWLKHCSERTGPFVYGRTQLTLTFQKEVGKRIVAKTNADNRCRLSVMCQYLCHVDHMFVIPGKAFFPRPEVDVSVVKFIPRIKPLINQPFKLVEKLVSTVFHHRQKYCSYGLKLLYPPGRDDLYQEILKRTNIDPEERSFDLEIAAFSDLCDVYSEQCSRIPNLIQYNYMTHARKNFILETAKENEENALV